MLRSRDIRIVIYFALLTILFVLLPPFNTSIIRTIFGIPMILFMPGYALIAALFPGKNDIDCIERLALSFGLSIAVVPLIGLGLNFTPFGIRLLPVLISISAFTISMCLIAFNRRARLPEEERFEVDFSFIYSSLMQKIFSSKSKVDKILTLVLLLSILVSIFTLAYVIVTPKQGEKFTEFYILGENGMAESYPTLLETGKNSSIIVGITNHEYRLTNYTLNILLMNDTLYEMNIPLIHNSTWEERVFFTPVRNGVNVKLEFMLFKADNFTVPYRDLHLWVNVT